MDLSRLIFVAIIASLVNADNADRKYDILGLLPYNGKSHFYVAEVLFEELARRGHNVTVVSHYPKKIPIPNYHDINMESPIADGIHRIDMNEISTRNQYLQMAGFHRTCVEGLSHPNVQKLLRSNDHYDLVITEMFNADCFLGFVHKFKALNVALRTSALPFWLSDRTGSPDNPAYTPGTTTGYTSHMSFLDRVSNVINYATMKALYAFYDKWGEYVARQHFGQDMPNLHDIARNTSLYLVNSYFVHLYAKVLGPNVKEIAGIHIRKAKPLPKDLENWVAGAEEGLIYLNLGSMINPSSMAAEKKRAFLEVFAQLPQRVLMKWDTETLAELPKNVRLTRWAPQNDVLHHPNVRLFITHGGMLGNVEAVHAGVPTLIIPFFGDQLTNGPLLQDRGLGIVLNYRDITEESLNRTLRAILFDTSFTKRVKELSAAFQDRPLSPLNEAVFWIEYLLRHRSIQSRLLIRPPSADLNYAQYLLIDVCCFFAIVIFTISLTTYECLKFLCRRSNKTAKKQKRS